MRDLGMRATREAYGDALAEFGARYDFVVLDADLSGSTKTAVFQAAFPERFVNCGIAESNMMAVAAGIAATGRVAFASTFAMFAAGRAFDAVRNGIGYPGLNVKIGASHAGLSVGEDGATHQCNEDLALMRSIPGMTVLCPADAVTTRAAVRAAIEHPGPFYLRLGRLAVPTIYGDDAAFALGRGILLREGRDVAIVATGLMVARALQAADLLAAEGIDAAVVDMHTIKPLDEALLTALAARCGAVVTAEEHSVIGGLGGAVAECLCRTRPVPVLPVGVPDVFGCSGKAEQLLTHFGLTAGHIAEVARQAVSLK
ncbi:MAG: transketolase family protein [Clostridiales bacterium]|nr:transketolase family protein [Clostridiales bacterium]